jgi:hypothetical protein
MPGIFGRSPRINFKTKKGKTMAEFKFEIKKEIAVLSTSKSGWNRELNFVSWNDASPKLDLRDWAPDHKKMGKGITLTQEEANILRELLNQISLDELYQ